MSWVAVAVVGTSAVSGYMSSKDKAKAAKAQAEAANKPTSYSNQTSPYGPFQDNLNTIANDSLANYNYQRDNAAPPPSRGSYGGGSYGQVSGASDLENQLANAAGGRALGQNGLLDSGSSALQGLNGGAANPLLQGAYDSAANFTNPYLNAQVAAQQRGSGSRASGLLEGLYGQWAGADAMNAGNDAYNRYYSQGEVAPTNLTGGDMFSGMSTSGQGGSGGFTSAGQWSRAPAMGGGGTAGPKSPLQEAYDAEMLRTMQGEYQNADSNPYLQQILDQVKRDADKTLASRNQALGQSADGLGRFGSTPYMQQAMNNEGLYSQEYLDRVGGLQYQNYSDERGIMQQALDRMNNQNQWQAGDATARAGISASSRSASDATNAQLAMARDANKLQALGQLGQLEGQNQDFLGNMLGTQSQLGLGALNTQAGLGQAAAGNQISALGLTPGMDASYYSGYGAASQLAGQVRQGNQSAQQANQQAAMQAANQQYEDAMNRWNWENTHQYNNLGDLYNLTMGPAQAFGTQSGTQQGPQVSGWAPSPWGGAVSGALSGVASLYGGYGG